MPLLFSLSVAGGRMRKLTVPRDLAPQQDSSSANWHHESTFLERTILNRAHLPLLDDEYRRVWWQSATLLATNLIYTPKKIEQNGKKQHKKTAIALVDLDPKTGANGNLP